jgi:MFS transporter, ACS family, tartrate transporter
MRFLLGAAEAGFFPGIILYLTYWFPARYRARIVALFMVAIPASSFLGSGVSGILLSLNGVLGLHGWQWMFIGEGIPTVILGVLSLVLLRDGPSRVKWLSSQQSEWLIAELNSERSKKKAVEHAPIWRVLFNKYVLAGALIYGGSTGASACLSIWLPQILKSYGLTNMQTALSNAVPFGVAALVMVLWARHSDKANERIWHTALPLAAIAMSLSTVFLAEGIVAAVLIFTIAVSATYCVKGPFWALSTQWLSASTAAVGIAQINAIGGLWSGLSTYLLGEIKNATGSYVLGLTPMIAITAAGALMVLLLGRSSSREHGTSDRTSALANK